MNLAWMAWTPLTGGFFIVIGLMLAGMTTWSVLSPSVMRRGFLPISTTRGDRLYIGLLGSAYVNIAWVGLTDWSQWIALLISVVCVTLVMRFG